MLNPYFHGIYYTEGIEEVPLMRPDTGPLPDELIGFNEMGKPRNVSQRNAVHFYLYDNLILRYYRTPEKYFDTLKNMAAYLGLTCQSFTTYRAGSMSPISSQADMWDATYRKEDCVSFHHTVGGILIPLVTALSEYRNAVMSQ